MAQTREGDCSGRWNSSPDALEVRGTGASFWGTMLGRGEVPGKPAGVAPVFTSCPAPLTSQQFSNVSTDHFFLGRFHRLPAVGLQTHPSMNPVGSSYSQSLSATPQAWGLIEMSVGSDNGTSQVSPAGESQSICVRLASHAMTGCVEAQGPAAGLMEVLVPLGCSSC